MDDTDSSSPDPAGLGEMMSEDLREEYSDFRERLARRAQALENEIARRNEDLTLIKESLEKVDSLLGVVPEAARQTRGALGNGPPTSDRWIGATKQHTMDAARSAIEKVLARRGKKGMLLGALAEMTVASNPDLPLATLTRPDSAVKRYMQTDERQRFVSTSKGHYGLSRYFPELEPFSPPRN